MLTDPRPEKFQSEKSPNRVEKKVVSKEKGDGRHGHCIAVGGMM